MNTEILPNDWSLWSTTKPVVIRALEGGLTNQNFLLSAGDKRFVLRINSPISDALNLDRVTEAQVLLLADTAGVCAPLVYCDSAYQYLITEHLAGEVWSVDVADGLSQLAQLLRKIHQLPPVDAVLDVESKASHYWRSINQSEKKNRLPDLHALDAEVIEHIAAAKLLSQGNCLCHNDLLKDNLVLAAGKLYAIDWEYAAMADPFYELAVIVEGHGFTHQQQQIFLSAYLDRDAQPKDWWRLNHWRIIYAYLTVLWYTVQWSTGAMTGLHVQKTIAEQIASLTDLMAKGVGVES